MLNGESGRGHEGKESEGKEGSEGIEIYDATIHVARSEPGCLASVSSCNGIMPPQDVEKVACPT
jgi:hypothetical protein